MSDFALGLDLKASIALDFSVVGHMYFQCRCYIFWWLFFLKFRFWSGGECHESYAKEIQSFARLTLIANFTETDTINCLVLEIYTLLWYRQYRRCAKMLDVEWHRREKLFLQIQIL